MFFQHMMKCLLGYNIIVYADCYSHMLIHNTIHQSLPNQKSRNRSKCSLERGFDVRNLLQKLLEWARGAKQERLADAKIGNYTQVFT